MDERERRIIIGLVVVGGAVLYFWDESRSTSWLIIIVVAAAAVAYFCNRLMIRQKRSAAIASLQNLLTKGVQIKLIGGPTPNVAFDKGEDLLCVLPKTTLLEARAVRTWRGGSSGPSFRIARGISYRFGSSRGTSESHEELRAVDRGTLAFTNQRLIFLGLARTTSVDLEKIVSIEPLSDGVRLHREGKEKAQYFQLSSGLEGTFQSDGKTFSAPISGGMIKAAIDQAILYRRVPQAVGGSLESSAAAQDAIAEGQTGTSQDLGQPSSESPGVPRRLSPDKDNWETDWLQGSPGEIQVEVEANIHYRDGRGRETRRDIRTRTMCPYGDDFAILAFCRDVQAHRTFLVSRIQRFVDLATGKPVSDVVGYLKDMYARSPRGATDAVLEARHNEAAVLVFIARATGTITAKERASISRFLYSSVPSGCSLDDNYLSERLRDLTPNPREYRANLREAANLPPDRRLALTAAIDDLEMARSKIDASTAAALAVARRILTPPAAGAQSSSPDSRAS
jgi:hypothetical protein